MILTVDRNRSGPSQRLTLLTPSTHWVTRSLSMPSFIHPQYGIHSHDHSLTELPPQYPSRLPVTSTRGRATCRASRLWRGRRVWATEQECRHLAWVSHVSELWQCSIGRDWYLGLLDSGGLLQSKSRRDWWLCRGLGEYWILAAYVVNEYFGCLSWLVRACMYGTFLLWYLWLSSMKKDVEILEVNMATLNVETMSLMSSRIANGMTSLQLSLIVCLVTYSQSHNECISRLWVSRVVPLAQPSARMEWIRCRQTERKSKSQSHDKDITGDKIFRWSSHPSGGVPRMVAGAH